MEGSVRRPAESHIDGDGVLEGVEAHDLPRQYHLFHEIDDCHARPFRQMDALCVNRRDGPIPPQAYAEGLTEAVHGVGREHARTGTGARTGASFELSQL